ncbi:hypothetical protein [Pseudomonas panipatensis]|jgi:hypothetical protein|uniref:hypothetical protein n=1 Tax=Pseudomonas panipatensis TaxID=428992 RepID=UPI0035B4CD5F
MPNEHDRLRVEREARLPTHAPRVLRGRLSRRDYQDPLQGTARGLVRLDDCHGGGRTAEDLFIRSAHIHWVLRADEHRAPPLATPPGRRAG